jgi:hypothetical protein
MGFNSLRKERAMKKYLIFLAGGFLGLVLASAMTDHIHYLIAGFVLGVFGSAFVFAICEVLGDPYDTFNESQNTTKDEK